MNFAGAVEKTLGIAEHACQPLPKPESSNTKHELHLVAYLIIIGSIGLLVALTSFFWGNYGPKSGRSFGNEIASYNQISRKTFWYLLDNGAKGSSLDTLKNVERSSKSLKEASIALAPTLQRGLDRLEARFGPQAMYEPAKTVISRLLASTQSSPDRQANEQDDA